MFRSIKNIFLREIRLVVKEHSLLLTLLGAPLLYAFMYGSIYLNKVETQVPLAIIDHDKTATSRLLTREIASDPMILPLPAQDLAQAQEMMNQETVAGYFYINQNFEKDILSLKQSNVSLAVNASKFLPASDLTAHLTTICLTVSGGVRKKYFNKQGMNDSQAMANTNPIQLDFRPLFNEKTGYGNFLLPGLMAVILQQTLLIGLCVSMSLERQSRKLGELQKLSLNSVSNILVGKGLFYFLVFIIFSQFFINVVFSVFSMPFKGSFIEINFLMALFFVCIIPMAFFIGSFFKNTLLIVQLMGFSSYPIFLITGYSMPFQNLPIAIQWISNFLPTTPFLRIYTLLVQGGASIADQLPNLFHLTGLGVLYTALLMMRMKFLQRELQVKNARPTGNENILQP
ncbi:ABC transporter permease [Elizabethkingia sp. JS20170427COW]|uniref:ABC transporter permease n=1 Tax=Elizabethkingia sp. JS20170427COW TaxID=2583851 RepID=UPI002104D548|nr:ABC transporter permease [Elizabethkingia sp. JS20170427COW]